MSAQLVRRAVANVERRIRQHASSSYQRWVASLAPLVVQRIVDRCRSKLPSQDTDDVLPLDNAVKILRNLMDSTELHTKEAVLQRMYSAVEHLSNVFSRNYLNVRGGGARCAAGAGFNNTRTVLTNPDQHTNSPDMLQSKRLRLANTYERMYNKQFV